MRRNIIILSNGLSAFLIVTQFGIWNALVMFLLVGAIPGTTISISPLTMLIITSFAFMICAFIFVTSGESRKPTKKSLPRKRYGRI